MQWEAVAASGELIGAVAVCTTLIFLIRQLRQNTQALRQQSERNSTDAISQWSREMMDPDVARAVNRAFDDPEKAPVSGPDMVPIEHFALSLLIILQQDFLDWKRGLQSDDVWASRAPLIRAVFLPDVTRNWWRTIGHVYVVDEFRHHIDRFIAEEQRDGGSYFKPLEETTNADLETRQ